MYEKLKDPKLSNEERISIEGKLDRNIVYANRDFVLAEEQMIKNFASQKDNKTHILKKSIVLQKIKEVNAEFKKGSKKKYEAELAKQTPEYLAALSEEARIEAKEKLALLKDKYVNGGLKAEQVNSILQSTTVKGGLVVIQGASGTGKSTQAKVTVDLYKEQGFTVYALGSSQANTDNLADSVGIDRKEAFNASKFLANVKAGLIKVDSKTVLMADEFSMLGSADWQEFGKLVADKGCKVVSMGDEKQCAAISTSDGFSVLSKLFTTATLKEVSRQELSWQCQATIDFMNGKGDRALTDYAREGRVDMSSKNLSEAVEVAVTNFKKEYAEIAEFNKSQPDKSKHRDPFKECLILASQNSTCSLANEKIRDFLKEEGVLKGLAVQVKTNDGTIKELQAGDKIMFLGGAGGSAGVKFDSNGKITKDKKSKEGFTLTNGEEATVLSVNSEKRTFTVQVGKEKREIKADQRLELTHSYAWSIHKSQGQSREKTQCIIDNTSMINLNLMYVMLSRQKVDLKIILNDKLKGDKYGEVLQGPPLPEHKERMLEIIKEQNITFKTENVKPSSWSYYKVVEFLKANDPDYIKRGEEQIKEYQDVLKAARTATDKKTSWDYKYLDKEVLEEKRERIERQLQNSKPNTEEKYKSIDQLLKEEKNKKIFVEGHNFLKNVFKPFQWQQVKQYGEAPNTYQKPNTPPNTMAQNIEKQIQLQKQNTRYKANQQEQGLSL